MKRRLVITGDGSHTFIDVELDEPYHSMKGAMQESQHVFIGAGFDHCRADPVRILEIGFGTGLNMLLTLIRAVQEGRRVEYHAVERYPLSEEEAAALNYGELTGEPWGQILLRAHRLPWNAPHCLTECFTLFKELSDFREMDPGEGYNLVYFDAFAPGKQPDLWVRPLFWHLYRSMAAGGTWVSYSAKGSVRRDLTSAGFRVEKIPGPPGKREMTRAVKD